MAKGKLTQVEKYTIIGMVESNKEVAEIAKVLGRTENVINKFVDSLEPSTNQQELDPKHPVNVGHAIMTREKSMDADESRKNYSGPDNSKYIHKLR